MNEIDLAYLAGIVDGEGSIELKLQKSGTLDLIVHVFNSASPLFIWIESRVGAGKTYDIHRRARIERPDWAPVFNWNISGEPASALLIDLLPYLVIKDDQARLAIEAWNNRQPMPRSQRRWGPRTSPDVIAMRQNYVAQMHAFNARYRTPKSLSN